MFPGAQNYYQQPQGSPYTSSYMGGSDPQQGNPQQQQQLQAKMQALQQQNGWNPNASQMGAPPQSSGSMVGQYGPQNYGNPQPTQPDANQMALARQQMLTQQATQQQPQQGGGGFFGALSHVPGLGFMQSAPMPPGVRSLPGMGGGPQQQPGMQPGSPSYQAAAQGLSAGLPQGQLAPAPQMNQWNPGQGQPQGGFGGAAQAIGQQAGQMFGSNLQRPGPPQGQPPGGMDPQAQQNYATWLQQRNAQGQGQPPQQGNWGSPANPGGGAFGGYRLGSGQPPPGGGGQMQGYGGGMPRFSMPQQQPQGQPGQPQGQQGSLFGAGPRAMAIQQPQPGMYSGGGWGSTFAQMQPQPMQQMPMAQSSGMQVSPQFQQQNPQIAQVMSQL